MTFKPITFTAHIELAEENEGEGQITVILKEYSGKDGHDVARKAEAEFPENVMVHLNCLCAGVKGGARP